METFNKGVKMQIDAKVIQKIFIDRIKNENSLPAKNLIWDLCQDFIHHFPELEEEEKLQEEFVKLYDDTTK